MSPMENYHKLGTFVLKEMEQLSPKISAARTCVLYLHLTCYAVVPEDARYLHDHVCREDDHGIHVQDLQEAPVQGPHDRTPVVPQRPEGPGEAAGPAPQ